MDKPIQKRQGDIFFSQVDPPSNKASLKHTSDPILYHGEVTGHNHAISDGIDLSKVEILVDEDGSLFIRGKEDITIGHDEHATITLTAGTWWKASRQQEYDPVKEHARIAAD
jgi:hypothetical protein